MPSTTTPVAAPFTTTSPTVLSSPMVNPAPYSGSAEDSSVFFFNASWPWRCSYIDFQRNAPKCPSLFPCWWGECSNGPRRSGSKMDQLPSHSTLLQPISKKSLENLLVIPQWVSNLLMIMLAAASGRNERLLLTTYLQSAAATCCTWWWHWPWEIQSRSSCAGMYGTLTGSAVLIPTSSTRVCQLSRSSHGAYASQNHLTFSSWTAEMADPGSVPVLWS